MPELFIIPLHGRVPGSAGIEFLRAEMPAGVRSSLALIRYKQYGQEMQYGVRLDLDKRVFLDHFEDAAEEDVLQHAAPRIVSIMAKELCAAREHAYTLVEGK